MLVQNILLLFSTFLFSNLLCTHSLLSVLPPHVTKIRGRSAGSFLDMKYCLSVKLSINPARRLEFLECIRANALGTLTTEPKCKGYTWGESTTQPNVFHFQEQFVDKEGFEAHTKMPHFLVWEKFASSPDAFTAPPVLDFFEELS